MKIAIDISPISPSSASQHKVRGVGMYIKNLVEKIKKIDRENDYVFFVQGEKMGNDIDLVHYPYFDPFFLTLPFKKKFRTVITVHDLTPIVFKRSFPVGVKGNLKWQLQKSKLKSADIIITDSEASKNDIKKIIGIGNEKIKVVYLAPGENFKRLEGVGWKESLIKKYNLPKEFALYVGDVTWNKNLPNLSEAIKGAGIPLVMVGKALGGESFDKKNIWNSDLVKVLDATRNNQQFMRLGFVSDKDLVGLYNLAKIFVMPSFYEGFGLPIIEAMKCGCPVVTSKEGSLKEVAGNAAFFVEPQNISSIRDGLVEVFSNDKLRAELSKKGLENAEKFSWEKTARETINVYREIIKA